MDVQEVNIDPNTEKGKQLASLLEELSKKKEKPMGELLFKLSDHPEIEDFIAEKNNDRKAFLAEMKADLERMSEKKKEWVKKFETQNTEFWAEFKPLLVAGNLLPEGYDDKNDNLHIDMKNNGLFYEKQGGPKHLYIES